MLFDHVLHPAAGAVELVVEMLRPAVDKVGDDEAAILEERQRIKRKTIDQRRLLHRKAAA